MTGVGGNCQRAASPSPMPGAAVVDSAAMLDTTCQSAGAVTASS